VEKYLIIVKQIKVMKNFLISYISTSNVVVLNLQIEATCAVKAVGEIEDKKIILSCVKIVG
jgi:hypothetical protein